MICFLTVAARLHFWTILGFAHVVQSLVCLPFMLITIDNGADGICRGGQLLLLPSVAGISKGSRGLVLPSGRKHCGGVVSSTPRSCASPACRLTTAQPPTSPRLSLPLPFLTLSTSGKSLNVHLGAGFPSRYNGGKPRSILQCNTSEQTLSSPYGASISGVTADSVSGM